MKIRTVIAVCLACPALAHAEEATAVFRVPSLQEQVAAVGRLDALPLVQRRAFAVTDDFTTIRRPGPRDWLATHPEKPQTFDDFLRSKRNTPTCRVGTIYLQPFGTFAKETGPPLAVLRDYASAFFGLAVKVLPGEPLVDDKTMTRRTREDGNVQFLTDDILTRLQDKLPADAFCVLGITMEDLYPEDSWNYVFGQATYAERVGVFSFKRYTPEFNRLPQTAESQRLLLRRSCDVMVHEIGHMFGLNHCTWFECVMCGSNNLPESDARPMHACPVCLRKLHSGVPFDLMARCQWLAAWHDKHGMSAEAAWYTRRLARLKAP